MKLIVNVGVLIVPDSFALNCIKTVLHKKWPSVRIGMRRRSRRSRGRREGRRQAERKEQTDDLV